MPKPTPSRHEGAAIWWTGMLLTALCLAIYVAQPAFVQSGSNLLYDAFMRTTHQSPQSDSIVLLDVDEESLERLGQWPWPRWMLADLANVLFDAGAAVLVFDMLFPEPDRTSPDAIAETYLKRFGRPLPLDSLPEDSRNFDAFFSRSIRDRPVVLGCEMIPGGDPAAGIAYPENDGYANRVNVHASTSANPALPLFSALDVKQALPILGSGTHRGFINALPDADGTIRSTPLIWSWGDRRLYPSLALEAFRLFRREPCVSAIADHAGIHEIRVGNVRIPTDALGRMVLNYRSIGTNDHGLVSTFPHISAHLALANQFDPAQVRGRIVIVGTSAAGLKDAKSTPLSPVFSGMEVHAVALDNLLAGDMVCAPSSTIGLHAVFIALVGTTLVFLCALGNSRLSFLGFLVLLAALPAGSFWLLSRHGLAFIPAWEILSLAILYPVLTTLRFWREERQRKWVRMMFRTMVSDRVLQYLEQHPDSTYGCGFHCRQCFGTG